MVIAVAGCDNVEWGGFDVAVVPPPPTAPVTDTELEAADRLPDGAILYYVRRDSLRAEILPVGEVTDEGLRRIEIGGEPEAFGSRFIAAFMRQGAELTLFSRGRRAGTVIVDSASVPGTGVCRRLPRAYGHMELAGGAGQATEFLAMARTQAPSGRTMPGETVEPDRRMRVLGPMIAERALRARRAQLPNWNVALRQMVPFPLSEARDMGFAATFLVDDELAIGNDDIGYSLFIIAVPQGQAGYDSAYVRFANYPQTGKQAPRVVDFLDWSRDGSPELLLQVYGTRNAWFEAVGRVDDDWQRILEDPCDGPRGGAVVTDPASVDPASAAPAAQPPGTPSGGQQPAPTGTDGAGTGGAQTDGAQTGGVQTGATQTGGPPPRDTNRATVLPALEIPDIMPQIRLSIPGQRFVRDTARPASDTTDVV